MVCCHRRKQSPGLPLQRPWVTWVYSHAPDSVLTHHHVVITWLWLHPPAGTEELWFGISFQPLERQLWWEPACPVAATVALCQRREEDICLDLPHSSQNVSKGKVNLNCSHLLETKIIGYSGQESFILFNDLSSNCSVYSTVGLSCFNLAILCGVTLSVPYISRSIGRT